MYAGRILSGALFILLSCAAELLAFATDYLKVDYIFWGTQEPYFSDEVMPLLKRLKR